MERRARKSALGSSQGALEENKIGIETAELLFGPGDKRLIRVRKLNFRRFCVQLNPHQLSFFTAVAGKAKKVLVREMHPDFIQIGFDGDRGSESEIIGLASGRLGHFAHIVLSHVDQEEGTAAVAYGRVVDAPEINVLALGAVNHAVPVGVKRPK